MWFNFHTHSDYCDGKGSLTDFLVSAQKKPLASLGFSSHAPIPFPCTWCMPVVKLTSYLDAVEQLKTSAIATEIYKGLEIDYIPGAMSPATFRDSLDYTIGSIHFVDAFQDGKPWEIDGPHLPFLEGLRMIFHDKIQDAVTRYFELTREMVEKSEPTIVGHLDKIKIQNPDHKFFNESDRWYVEEVKKTLGVIKRSNSIVEVNTRGLYQKKSPTTYPSPWILELIFGQGIPITISSDAHHPDDLTREFESTATMLGKIGFRKLAVMKQQKWQSFDFDMNGIHAGQ